MFDCIHSFHIIESLAVAYVRVLSAKKHFYIQIQTKPKTGEPLAYCQVPECTKLHILKFTNFP